MSGFKLLGKSALISGGSRGIGLAIAEGFAEHGASCTLLGRKAETLTEALAKLDTTHNQRHSAFVIDVRDASRWQHFYKQQERIDVLVNAAGLTHYSLLPRTPEALIEDVLDINLLGTILACKVVVRLMLSAKKRGCIINISSALAHSGGAGSSVYAASKAGVLGFTRALAEELGPRGIRCNAIAPGYIKTDMLAGMTDDLTTDAAKKSSVGRIGSPEEVADAALFLASNQFANGTTLTLDGGLSYH